MKNIDKYLVLKESYQEYVILIKSGNFYYTYLNDALLLRYFFNYQIIGNRVGFPVSVKNKILNFLKMSNISSMFVDGENTIIYANTYNKYLDELEFAKEDFKREKELNDLYKYILKKIKDNFNNYSLIKEFVDEL